MAEQVDQRFAQPLWIGQHRLADAVANLQEHRQCFLRGLQAQFLDHLGSQSL
ncbi:hypothetical protein D3C81_2112270 [compost metagenome]